MTLAARSLHTFAIIIIIIIIVVVVAAGPGCAREEQQSAIDRLRPCTSDEGPTDAYCGTFAVYENRKAQAGRKIDLKIVLLPGLSTDAKPDPLFFLAGGPGQGAAAMAKPLRELFRRVQDERDIVLVDQRGTGKSHPLACKSDDDSLGTLDESDAAAFGRLRKCLERFDADPRLYTTSIAMDDLDDIRTHLGYDKINLYGGSYGTRAALVYLRQHEPHVRAIVLDGVAPTDMRLPLFFARDAQRAMDLLLADCEADEACRKLHPSLAPRLRALVERLEKEPVRTRLVHPRTGVAQDTGVKASLVAGILFNALYSPLASSLIPALIERAERNDFQGMLALALSSDPGESGIAIGMQLSVVCAEDVPRITPAEVERESSATLFGPYLLESRMKACEFWPRGEVGPEYYQPVVSSVPALVLSGALDPVTPPTWGEAVAKTLSNSRHLIAPGTGHGVITTGCGMRLIRDFLDRGSAEGLDDSCLKALKRPPFFLTPAGPDPLVSSRPAR